jgi:heptosyltransferase-3
MARSETLVVARTLYWRFRRNPRLFVSHITSVLLDFLRAFATLWVWRHVFRRRSIILISQVEFMGDILAMEPISRQARRHYPDSYIVWVARKPFRDMIKQFRTVDNVLTVVCLTVWMLLLKTGRKEIVWDLHVSRHCCGKCAILHYTTGAAGEITQETYYSHGNLLAVACLNAGIAPILDGPRFDAGEGARVQVDKLGLPSEFVVIHCQSNDKGRNWTQEKWQSLASYIDTTLGFRVIEVGTRPVDAERDNESIIDLCGKLSIPETAEVIRRAALFVGVDSGPAHIANAVGTQGVIVLGRYLKWNDHMPYSGFFQTAAGADLVRTSGALTELPLEPVVRSVSKRLERPRLAAMSEDNANTASSLT